MYAIGDIKLVRPIALSTMIYLLAGIFLSFMLSKIPLFAMIPASIRFVGIPAIVVYLMSKIRPHSKSPLRFIISFAEYAIQPKRMVRFHKTTKEQSIRFDSVVKGKI